MDYLLKKYLPQIEFASYEEFREKFTINVPEDFNFGFDVVDAWAEEEPDKRALVWCNVEGDERIFTFGEISRLSNRAANVLRVAGVGRGDRVMMMLKRHYEYWICAVALHKLGAVMIPATHMLTVDDLSYRLRCAGAGYIICTPQNGVPGKVLAALEQTGRSATLWTVQQRTEGFRYFNEEMEAASDVLERCPTLASDPMHFTVAETGWAKSSWGKIYGQWLTGCAVMVYDFDNFDPRRLIEIINRYGVTSFCAPPTVYRYLVRKGIAPMPTLRHACTAGEALAQEVFEKFEEITGLPLAEGYGQTETTLLLANFGGRRPVSGALGTPSPQYRVEIRLADGTPAQTGEIGEIVVVPWENKKAPGILTGYLGDDQESVWSDGVYHTGDAAWRDEDGICWFHGRFDDIIKTGGFRVGPSEVENVLQRHPAVAECSVVGVPDPARGQAIKAVVRLAKGREANREMEKELRDFCNAQLAEYKWVRMVAFVDEMPKTISGKIRKTELR